jgi:FkbM family methyltransferase
MKAALKRTVKALVPAAVVRWARPKVLARSAHGSGIQVQAAPSTLDVVRDGNVVRISKEHAVYLPDILTSFDYYFSAVKPLSWRGRNVVDYSSPRYHDVIGFDDFPILFPSFSEPLVTTTQYLDFAGLEPGMSVIDLGAYAGLTSIMFARQVGPSGHVIAVDADAENMSCIEENTRRYRERTGQQIELLRGAIWNHDNGIEFSIEGNMGSSAASIVGRQRGKVSRVESFTLANVVEKFGLSRVDFVKCDVEGAEQVIFDDERFFSRFRPRIIVETHLVGGVETTEHCIEQLSRWGYVCRRIPQHGVTLPLLACTPPTAA